MAKALGDSQSVAQSITSHVEALNGVSGNVLGNVSDLSGKLETQLATLAEISARLENSNNTIEDTFQARHAVLEQVAQGIMQKSEDVETRMRAFSSLIAETLAGAEDRAEQIGINLSRNAEKATSGVIQQLAAMSTTAGEEGSKASEAVRRAQAELAESISSAIGDATSRFQDATQEMRSATESIRGELNTVRAELHKATIELPEETRENMATMRRVVAEQIQALSDLSEIVNSHAKPSSTIGTGRIASTSAPSRPSPVRPTVTAPRTASAEAPAAPKASAPIAPAEPTRAAAAPEKSGGWVSNLLERASHDDHREAGEQLGNREERKEPKAEVVGRNEPQMVESLNSLSADIAQAIDHNTSLELWERYNKGERNVFTRRLYTIAGQKTFDDIRRKYQADGDFRTAVNQYILDFEKLITDVKAKHGDDPILVEKSLISDTGKVYTMLSHASGKLT